MSRAAGGLIPAVVAAPDHTVDERAADDDPTFNGVDDPGGAATEASADCEAPLNGQQPVDAEAAKWAAEWEDGQSPPCPHMFLCHGEPIAYSVRGGRSGGVHKVPCWHWARLGPPEPASLTASSGHRGDASAVYPRGA